MELSDDTLKTLRAQADEPGLLQARLLPDTLKALLDRGDTLEAELEYQMQQPENVADALDQIGSLVDFTRELLEEARRTHSASTWAEFNDDRQRAADWVNSWELCDRFVIEHDDGSVDRLPLRLGDVLLIQHLGGGGWC